MFVCGVEFSPFSRSRYCVIDCFITFVVAAVCLPVFVMVAASRVYTGVLLGLAAVFFCKLWRFLPSHRRWVEHQARKRAECLVAEWRTMRPSAQGSYTPTAVTGMVEMSAVNPTPMSSTALNTNPAAMSGSGLPPYYYYGRSPNCSPYPGTPCGPLMLPLPPPPAPPATAPVVSLPPVQPEHGQDQNGVWGRQQQFLVELQQPQPLPRSPWCPYLPAITDVQAVEPQRLSYPPSPRRSPSPYLPLPFPPPPPAGAARSCSDETERRCTAVEDSVRCSHPSRSASAATPLPSPSKDSRRSTPAAQARRPTDDSVVRRWRSPQEAPFAFSEHSLPAVSRPVAGARGGSRLLWRTSLPPAHRSALHRHPRLSDRQSPRRRPPSLGSRSASGDVSPRSSGSVGSSSVGSPLDDAPYAVAWRPSSPSVFLRKYG
ncbi:hypothetical protein ABB37_02053 [Leptomonas pyrrhocoris]|uniref:Uncharacterized protein n=1 Tax=Leptomonas pyrrhocoris TaxID=157538 RepID=A0A0N0VGK6_LEPPY|nr:hypothetical protein ABB37_02053 [Leptomonas pyrrhocoris]KPA83858.1 hypothetical protein ABB37_02053 [Leptomonas pyrrhocoris]|eukprot:XP_015662297.1 hypothetical protein ABB37_02053 [Leptomonas pyrrhocoris]